MPVTTGHTGPRVLVVPEENSATIIATKAKTEQVAPMVLGESNCVVWDVALNICTHGVK